ncbi:hypothetical protein I6G82_06965 [Lysinibacillus macroides]|uniref:Helix-turn-helix domain-containing protein n=1 Tax=Lysinibacillus macroides TaxID=33935 RepID=A0A0M9DML8_9BACI|nr:hypothetical protein [Lysinibacillus macroides]KOY83470.1 hypothetical protein ADM90_09455 [Lysinibacillus macroides]QPR70510.1 hypothetical protein I6G82_06965 [Lysinibacillus macroides]
MSAGKTDISEIIVNTAAIAKMLNLTETRIRQLIEVGVISRAGEEEDIMKFTIKETKEAIRDYIEQAIDKKVIDKSWLNKFDKSEMTRGDFEVLEIIISQ